MRKLRFCHFITAYILLTIFLTGCTQTTPEVPEPSDPADGAVASSSVTIPGAASSAGYGSSGSSSSEKTSSHNSEENLSSAALTTETDTSARDNTPVCLVPIADGIAKTDNDVASIDYSHASDGYIMADYTGECPKVKLRIKGPDAITYTYDLHGDGYETFPLSSGNGIYDITVYENISGTEYSTCLYEQVTVTLTDEFVPFLYPNQYVNFTAESKVVQKGMELARNASSDLDVVTNIYNYIISSITYDYQKASDPPAGYTCDVDDILESGTGICLDYAAVMASMLRSQKIPTRLEVGYAQDAYHAWISVYIKDIGWLNGIIEFDGMSWTLVDPTFGASTDNKTLKKFIGNGSNYTLQKMY